MKNLKINEDWERESAKDFIYLLEEKELLNDSIQKELNKKQPAHIIVIDTHNILEKQTHEHQSNTLPF